MTERTRRTFLIASGAAAVGAAAVVPGVAQARTPADTPVSLPSDAAALMAHVADPSAGTVNLFVGEREVVVHDPDLVARLARAASRGL
ncbi:MAG: hypothetical protein QOE53_2347 [Pseudonocardiales bacterium]|nr:hypothetical protein [Pseudonocardiales bacterium]